MYVNKYISIYIYICISKHRIIYICRYIDISKHAYLSLSLCIYIYINPYLRPQDTPKDTNQSKYDPGHQSLCVWVSVSLWISTNSNKYIFMCFLFFIAVRCRSQYAACKNQANLHTTSF